MPTLYRKYRPGTFADVSGQETIVQTLQNEITMGRLSHAYLFAGPRGVGKTTLARLLAKAINCERRKKDSAEPCNECATCKTINTGRHIDVIEIDAASQTGVDNVRENIIENAGVQPTMLKHKIFIIDEVHMLSTSAFNALLKTLEEPPAHVVFILATTELHKLPATVVSRCERFTFKKIPFEQIVSRLKNICKEEKIKVDDEVINRVAHKSEGGLRDAESLLGQILSLDLKKITTEDIQMILPLSSSEAILNYLESLVKNDLATAVTIVNEQLEAGADLNQFALDLLEMLRYLLLIEMKAEKTFVANYSTEAIKRLQKMTTDIPVNRLLSLIDMTVKRRVEIKSAPIPQLPLELLAVEAGALLNATTTPTLPISPTTSTTPPTTNIPPTIEKPSQKPVENAIKAIADGIKQVITTITHDGEIKTTLEEIKLRWKEAIDKSASKIPSLSIILKMCTLKALSGNTLIVTVPYSLHKEKLDDPRNRGIIEGTLEAFFNERIRLAFEVLEPVVVTTSDSEAQSLAMDFGGEVVN
jgi:DNA polymerase-3 subunit gamma/tau